jgi:aminopeptidase S
VRIRVDAVSERRVTHNVIGERPATGRRRVMMLGAHLDSVPAGPGINDNASGAAAVLAAAERLAADGVAGVRVAFWGAEELGLYGSRRYVAGLSRAARSRIVAYVNLDMVGTPDGEPDVYDTDDTVERVLRRTLRAAGRRPGEERIGGASDHAPFARAGIPVGGVFTGFDRCYHRACDGARNVDVALLRDVTTAATTALRRLLERS